MEHVGITMIYGNIAIYPKQISDAFTVDEVMKEPFVWGFVASLTIFISFKSIRWCEETLFPSGY
jgi:hypothetical protein